MLNLISSKEKRIYLVQTPSSALEIIIKDEIKNKYNITSDAVIDIQTSKDLKKVKDLYGITPLNSDKWFVEIDLNKIKDKTLYKLIQDSTTCTFLLTCSRYSIFKTTKDYLKSNSLLDLYITYLRRADFYFLYNLLVPDGYKIKPSLIEHTYKTYSNDINSVITLFKHIGNGNEIETIKDITELCGIGNISIEGYIFDLLKPVTNTDRGIRTVIRNRLKSGAGIADELTYGKLYTYLNNSIFNMCQIKMLMQAGVVYDRIHKLPDTFDEKALVRYQKYLYKLRETPLSSLLEIKVCIGNTRWKKASDFISFIYTLYNIKYKEAINGSNM